jgi:hypothetical protein
MNKKSARRRAAKSAGRSTTKRARRQATKPTGHRSHKHSSAGGQTPTRAGREPPKRTSRQPPKRTGGQPPKRAGRPNRGPPVRSVDEPLQKVAPWRKWPSVALKASKSDGQYAVEFTVSGLGPARNERYGKLITSAAHKHFKIETPSQGKRVAAYLVEGQLRVVFDEIIVQFGRRVRAARCRAILAKAGFLGVKQRGFAKNQWIAHHSKPAVAGKSMLAAADGLKK